MLANRKRCVILVVAIALTTLMLTSLFTIGGSVVQSIEMNTMYQVGTSCHGGFKFLTEEEYNTLKEDPKISDLSYNIIVGDVLNDELYEDYTELRYTTEEDAKANFAEVTVGRLPEAEDEIATCTDVLDDFGIPHELGQKIHLKISNGFKSYEGDFTVCGIWEKPAQTLTNQVFVSRSFQKKFSPIWKNAEDKEKAENIGTFAGSINPGFNFPSKINLSGQMDELKERCGFGNDVNEGVNWAYSTSTIDFTSVAIVVCLLLLIILSGYLIIYNIFLIAVSSDIHYYGLLKTVGTTNRQLKRIVVKQGNLLSIIAIPIGLVAGYMVSIVLLPIITESMVDIPCKVYPSVKVFIASAAFAWFTVRISCFKPCKVIKNISPIEAVNYSDYQVRTRLKSRKGHRVTPLTMAWENLKRSRVRNVVVILSIALSIIMVNVTIGIVSSFDENRYVENQITTDFMVSDGSIIGNNYAEQAYDAVTKEDMDVFAKYDGVTDFGCIYFSESYQKLEGESLKRARSEFEEHPEWFGYSDSQNDLFSRELYEDNAIDSHIYGVDKLFFENIEMESETMGWEKFSSGKYAIVSSPIVTNGNDEAAALYRVGEKIKVTLPEGDSREYEVMAIGDIPYAMGPEHGHGLDINIILPENEYLSCVPNAKGALKCCFNAEEDVIDDIDANLSDYCETVKPKLGYESRKKFLDDFKEMIDMWLLVGGVLSFIIALIGILNFVNLTYTSMNERRNELATLKAIGMTEKQMTGMLTCEGLIRIAFAALLVLTAGVAINYGIVHLIAGQMIMFKYKFVIWPSIAAIPVLCMIAVGITTLILRCDKIKS